LEERQELSWRVYDQLFRIEIQIRGPSFLGHEVVHSRAFGDKALKHLSPARFRVFTIVAAAGWKYYFSVAETVYTIMLALHGPGDPSIVFSLVLGHAHHRRLPP
jgi:hypothetical protein